MHNCPSNTEQRPVTNDTSPTERTSAREKALRTYLMDFRNQIETRLRSRIGRQLDSWIFGGMTRQSFVDNCEEAFKNYQLEWDIVVRTAACTYGKEKTRNAIAELFPGIDYDST